MNSRLSNIVMVGAISLMSVSCGNTWDPDELLKKDGQVGLSSMTISVDNPLEGDTPPIGVDVSAYNVSIMSLTDNSIIGSWTYNEMPEVVTMSEGRYKVMAENSLLKPADWDSPYYFAEKEFTVKPNELVAVDGLTCKLSNVAVSVRYSESLLKALGDDAKVTVSTVDGASLIYVKDETRVGYFMLPDGASTLVASFEGMINGHPTSLTKSFSGISVGQHHYITFSVNTGSIAPGLIIDADLTFDDVDIDIPGVENPDENQPTITSQTLNLDGVNTITDELIARVDISVPNGIEKLEVTIISETLTPEELTNVGLTDHFDLAHPGEFAEALAGLGFPTGDDVLGQTTMTFDITSFMSLLVYFPGHHTFKLDVTDSKGMTASASLKFYTPEQ